MKNLEHRQMNSFLSLRIAFRYMEWFFITVHLVIQANNSGLTILKLIFFAAFILLAWIFPIDRPHYQKLGYLYLAISFLVWGKFSGVNLDLLIYLYLAKSCFLLNFKEVLFTAIITGFAWVLGEYISELSEYTSEFTSLEPAFRSEPPYGFGVFNPEILAMYTLGIYLTCSVFVIVFSYVLLAENKSRQQAERLAKQVEALAANLERTRIARDIHDSLGHTLTDLDIQLEVAQALRYSELNQSFQAIDNAKMLAKQCIEDVSQAIQTLRRPEFDLKQALLELIEQVKYHQSIQIHLEVDLPQLSPYAKHQLYCILKEGIVNVQKHARASFIRIQGQCRPTGFFVTLNDNGIGFELAEIELGFGLKGMIERAQLLGGELKIHSTLDQGTCIEIMLPL